MKALLVNITLLLSTKAMALTGLDLMKFCNGSSKAGQDICLGYIVGVVDAHDALMASGQEVYCKAQNVINEQTVLVVRKWMADNPSRLNEPQSHTVLNALAASFPCKR